MTDVLDFILFGFPSAQTRRDVAEVAAGTGGWGVFLATGPLALDVQNLCVGFAGTLVIDGLSFKVPHGSALAIVGPNGAGKSVLAKTLIGALPATAKRLARSLTGMLVISVAVSIASTTLGTWLSLSLHRTPGSMIVLLAAGFFLLSLLRRSSA